MLLCGGELLLHAFDLEVHAFDATVAGLYDVEQSGVAREGGTHRGVGVVVGDIADGGLFSVELSDGPADGMCKLFDDSGLDVFRTEDALPVLFVADGGHAGSEFLLRDAAPCDDLFEL